jgi:hypothetical protein
MTLQGAARVPPPHAALPVTTVRSLDLEPAPGEVRHVAAASGLVAVGDWLYVAVDDELYLAAFPRRGGEGVRHAVVPGHLPEALAARKAQKPDFEVVVQLPPFALAPQGALLLLGSGSKPGRDRAAWMPLTGEGKLNGPAHPVDLHALYAHLRESLAELNIEGAVVTAHQLVLFQRGNGAHQDNAVVRLPLMPLLRAVDGGASLPTEVSSIRHYALGTLRGIPLSFTDATLLEPNRILFSASAEDTHDTVADGPCTGAVLGVLEADGNVSWLAPLDGSWKVEGVHAERHGDGYEVLLVADGDDRTRPAPLLHTWIAPPAPRDLIYTASHSD